MEEAITIEAKCPNGSLLTAAGNYTLAQLYKFGEKLMEHGEDFIRVYIQCGLAELNEAIDYSGGRCLCFRVPVKPMLKSTDDIDKLCRKHFNIDPNHCKNPPIDIMLDPLAALVCMASAHSRSYLNVHTDVTAMEFYTKSGGRFRMVDISEPFASYLRAAEMKEHRRETTFDQTGRDAYAVILNRYQRLLEEAQEKFSNTREGDLSHKEALKDHGRFNTALFALRDAAEAIGLTAWMDIHDDGHSTWHVV